MEPSTELGRYRILGEIGRGASGTVYHALDTLIGREVAIKSFRPPAGETPAAGAPEPPGADLLREARSAGMLSHPNIVTVYDVIEGSGGAFSIAMEYVKGRSLAELLAESGRPDFERAVDWISQAAAALDHLHAMGLVHRDVKPANLLLTEDGRVKLTDFGIARSGPAEGAQDEDAVLGTPGYMAPEQILGREATPRTDVWSLTVVLYEMLLGERPFAGRTVAEVVHGVVHAPVPAPAEGAGLPDGVRALLERGMAKDPRWRFASAGELARELRQILYQAAGEAGAELAGEEMLDRTLVTGPVPAPAGPPARRAETRSGRRLGGRAAVAAAALVAVALAGVVYLAYRALGPDPGVAVATGAAPGTQERSLEVLRLLREGRRLLAAGDTEGAAVFFEVV
ncbi:MAG TPA: serine/threonine-protein kinase, partial [Thermoanaerobaculia bacterium]|nr:serine/threonine-protein kinase [Thermoanaerobaculia bacterium]